MTIVMNMSGYEVERVQAPLEEYGDEVLCSGWNPQLALVNAKSEHVELPPSLSNIDADAFLKKMYQFQR